LSDKINLLLLSSFSYKDIGKEAIVSEITLTQLQTVDNCKARSLVMA